MKNVNNSKIVLAYDSGAKGTRYINCKDDQDGTSFTEDAMAFDTKEEAQKFNDEKGYLCWVEEIPEEVNTYDIYFNDDYNSNSKGFKSTLEYCKNWIEMHNGSKHSYFEDYKGGTVSVVCNETEETVFETEVM